MGQGTVGCFEGSGHTVAVCRHARCGRKDEPTARFAADRVLRRRRGMEGRSERPAQSTERAVHIVMRMNEGDTPSFFVFCAFIGFLVRWAQLFSLEEV